MPIGAPLALETGSESAGSPARLAALAIDVNQSTMCQNTESARYNKAG